ncbi:hypothetical protein GC197_12475 [bacterium]|nr:hypothetical protein [bacterium]
MRKRLDIRTNSSTIGIWDPAHERQVVDSLRAEATAGRLFFIETSADGSYEAVIYVDEQPDPDCLSLYTPSDREFLIESQSGRLIAGGLEDFVGSTEQITSEKDQFEISAGRYALQFYELSEEIGDKPVDDELDNRLRTHLGSADYDYYLSKFRGLPWGGILIAAAIISLFTRIWALSAGLFAIWIAYLVVRSRIEAADLRFQEIAKRVDAFHKQYPWFIYVLRRVADDENIEGGWLKL